MSCPTCDATMEGLGEWGGRKHWHCPRCGTLRTICVDGEGNSTGYVEDYRPKLVDRCRQFAGRLPVAASAPAGLWQRLGIAESINVPAERPKS